MKILSPAKTPEEVRSVIHAGAGEIYCGVMPASWRKQYTNMVSPNRREWEVSNMADFGVLRQSIAIAHAADVPVFLALNALYTEKQYDALRDFVSEAMGCDVDALIIADIGLLLMVKEMGWDKDIHISTGGTTFNNETVQFYRDLGASRVILPRQNRLSEITAIAEDANDIEIESFVLNRGCKNIDGFCTFHHGVNEVRIPLWWRLPKKWHWDYYLLNCMKRLPLSVRERLARTSMFGSVGACFLSYDIDVESDTADATAKETLHRTLRDNFNLFSGLDTCGACSLWQLQAAGIDSLKIVGRSNPLQKKVRDVEFLRQCIDMIPSCASAEAFCDEVRAAYTKTYGFSCDSWCYYPAKDAELGPGEL